MNRLFPILTLCAGALWIFKGLQYGIWGGAKLGAGFMPVVAGLLAVASSIVVLYAMWKNNDQGKKFNKKVLIPCAAALAVVGCSYVLGLVISIGLYIFLWIFLYEKMKLRTSILTACITAVAIYLVFNVWLNIDFPEPLLNKVF